MNNLTDINYLKSFLKHFGLKPKHYLGQNFLVDQDVLDEILAAAELKKTDTVLEVGPGIGTLTFELVKHAGKVIAVEKDARLVELLRKNSNIEYRSTKQIQISNDQNSKSRLDISALDLDIVSSFGFRASNLRLVNQDVLRFHLDKHIQDPYKVVANIPYYLTSALLQYFLEQKNKPHLMVLMVQKEVAERIVARPGNLSILGISVQFYADAEIIAIVSKKSFWPMPEVDSTILKIVPKDKFPEIKDHKLFFRIVKAGFAAKRKQVHNTFRNGLGLTDEQTEKLLAAAGINRQSRAQELSLGQWINFYQAFRKLK